MYHYTSSKSASKTSYILFSLRPKQWAKNLFVFLPLIFGQKLLSYPENVHAILAFILFCVAASAIYILNDLIDLPIDRAHAAKRVRSIASGWISRADGLLAAGLLIVASVTGSFMLVPQFGWTILTYIAFNFVYSFWLKRIVIIDVFCLALFSIFRIAAGTFVAGVSFSYWMIFMIALLAMFLGFNKRRQSISFLRDAPVKDQTVHHKYGLYFIDQMVSVVMSTIVVTYMLYTVDIRTVQEFGSNHLIYSIPFVYYGLFRYLYLVHKRKMGDDPTLVLYRDPMLVLSLILWASVCIAVIYFRL